MWNKHNKSFGANLKLADVTRKIVVTFGLNAAKHCIILCTLKCSVVSMMSFNYTAFDLFKLFKNNYTSLILAHLVYKNLNIVIDIASFTVNHWPELIAICSL